MSVTLNMVFVVFIGQYLGKYLLLMSEYMCRYRYFGAISRSDAKSLLEDTEDGTFLVRRNNDPSTEIKFVLSVKLAVFAFFIHLHIMLYHLTVNC